MVRVALCIIMFLKGVDYSKHLNIFVTTDVFDNETTNCTSKRSRDEANLAFGKFNILACLLNGA